jgi:hypothetical protein
MSASAWQPFGIPAEEYEQASPRNGVHMLNLSLRRGSDVQDRAGKWLRYAMAALGVLASAAAAVSFEAQFVMVYRAKHSVPIAALEAGIPDVAAVVFAALGIALAMHGKRAIRARLLNIGAVVTSITMNFLAAGPGWRDLAIWIMPPVAYALASDTAIGVVRAHALARQRALSETLANEESTPLAALGGVLLWLLRLAMAPPSTLKGLRQWVVSECPAAPETRALTVTRANAEDARVTANIACEERDQAQAAFADASDALEQVREERDQAVREAAELLGTLQRARRERPALAAAGSVYTRPRGGTKTGRFLALVAERYGPLAGVPLDKVSRIASELAPEVDLNAGAARTALRARVLAEQDGDEK